MKKILTMMAVGMSSFIFCQLNYSVTAGYTMSNLKETVNGENASGFEPKHGYYAGLMLERKWGEKIAFQLETIYANVGAQQKIQGEGIEYTQVFNLNRLYVPLSFRYYITYEFAMYAGGYLNTRLSDKAKINFDGEGVSDEQIEQAEQQLTEFMKETLSGTDYGIHFGSDFKLYKGLFIDARYNIGLANLLAEPMGNSKLTMNFLQVGLGYKF